MDLICQKFLQAERDFLLAARSDNHLIVGFAERWQALHSEWESYSGQADRNTQELVDGVVANIGELAADLCVVESYTLSLEDDLFSGLEDVFASLTLEDPVVAPEDLTSNEQTEASGSSSLDPTTISPAQWLLRNLHNPYPLPHIRFSTHLHASSKHTKDWFAKARQRIGWTRLLRDRFAGCRSLAIDAAFRAFIRDDPVNPLDPDLKVAFFAIKSHTELVYGDESNVLHPSPKRLRSVSPTPSLTFSSTSEDTDDEQWSTPPSATNFNRPSKRVFHDPSDSPLPKRRRVQPSSPTPQPRGTLTSCAETTSLRSVKRRLSECSNEDSRPKRPRGMEADRSHAVSNPLPETVPTWFDLDKSFQIPNPASTDPLELTSFDVNFFNPLSLPSCIVSPTFAPPTDVATSVSVMEDFSALFKMPQLDLLRPTLATFNSDWTEFLNFEPDLPLSPSSPSIIPSLASTPPLVADANLSPLSLPNCGPSSPNTLLDILPHFSDKEFQFPALGEPIIQGQDFMLPPGESAGIYSASALLSVH